MKREEAIDWLKAISFVSDHHITEAIGMAIEALHREEAEEKGYCHRIRPSNVEVVVRCKDCRYWQDQEEGIVECHICTRIHDMVFEMGADGFCSYGERKGGGEK